MAADRLARDLTKLVGLVGSSDSQSDNEGNRMMGSEGIFVDVPGVGEGYVTAGVDFFRVRFGVEYVNTVGARDAAPLVVNGKTYARVELHFDLAGKVTDWYGQAPTTAGRAKVTPLVESWAADFVETAVAASVIRPVIENANRIGEQQIKDEIRRVTNYLRELEMIADTFRARDDLEYVSPYRGRSWQLKEY